MSEDGTLDREEMKKVGKLNPYLRDKCGVPFPKAFSMAMVIVENWEGIKNIVEQEDRQDD